ncbi:transketolase family protein [bacterium]|jgi:transketolase|nr:transketolase family protein [bacterium]MBT4334976.1 transketolase family protein [bacterium]MBT4496035.1 transketolase family protein [bacterium]MBT4764036.1 transketolase family protein [bacterium]MBT5401408.1 transketolase family protein [bacterium]
MLNKNYLNPDKLKKQATRAGFGDGLNIIAKQNKDVVGLCADLTGSLKMSKFAKMYPKRFFEMGVAEQNMAGVAAGLALSGKIPYMGSFSAFSPGRNWEQIRVSICYNKANVKIIGSHAGITVGEDGATHQALEDIATTRVLPNMVVINPADYEEAKKATIAIGKYIGPVYLRLSRYTSPIFTTKDTAFKIGKGNILQRGKDVTIFACGIMVYPALLAASKLLKNNIKATVVNLHTIKPLDEKLILKLAETTGAFVTVEEHQVSGGMGSAVAEFIVKNNLVPIEMLGIEDTFGESGNADKLLTKYGLTVANIVKKAKLVVKRK